MGHDVVGGTKKREWGTSYIDGGLGFLSANGSKGFQVQLNFALILARDGLSTDHVASFCAFGLNHHTHA